jgi:hypothetical protein
MARNVVQITCPACGRKEKTRDQSSWCRCQNSALWVRTEELIASEEKRLRSLYPTLRTAGDASEGFWRWIPPTHLVVSEYTVDGPSGSQFVRDVTGHGREDEAEAEAKRFAENLRTSGIRGAKVGVIALFRPL